MWLQSFRSGPQSDLTTTVKVSKLLFRIRDAKTAVALERKENSEIKV
jgi:hypothetical protein